MKREGERILEGRSYMRFEYNANVGIRRMDVAREVVLGGGVERMRDTVPCELQKRRCCRGGVSFLYEQDISRWRGPIERHKIMIPSLCER